MRWTHGNFGLGAVNCKYETQYAIERQAQLVYHSKFLKSSKSKAEFIDEISEPHGRLASLQARAELEYIHRRRTELCAEYMSDATLPDRKALYRQVAENALKAGQGGNPEMARAGNWTPFLYFPGGGRRAFARFQTQRY